MYPGSNPASVRDIVSVGAWSSPAASGLPQNSAQITTVLLALGLLVPLG